MFFEIGAPCQVPPVICSRCKNPNVKGLPFKCSFQLVAFAVACFAHWDVMCGDGPCRDVLQSFRVFLISREVFLE